MSEHIKYPRTYHLPWSLGMSKDDKMLKDTAHFIGKEVVVTEKMDGENTTLYRDGCHARSIDSLDHESQHWMKWFHAQISFLIQDDMRICGENLYAEHSIPYINLPSYFMCFSIWFKDMCVDWDTTLEYANVLGLTMVPTLYRGIWDEDIIKQLYTGVSTLGGCPQEGYVVRTVEPFLYKDFNTHVAKFVRKNHVTSDRHWKNQPIKRNELR